MRKINGFRILLITCFFVVLSGCLEKARSISLDRVAVTGASVTAGWGVKTPPIKSDFGAHTINMKHIMEAMILVPHEEVAYFGNAMFFTRPDMYGRELIADIKQYDPSLIVAVDYLFWFAYGNTGSQKNRIEKFKQGLALLSNIKSPLIIGDVPDVHIAIGNMLSASQVPTVQTINTMNRMLSLWSDSRPNVTVINANELYAALLHNTAIKTSHYEWPAGSQARLLQKDMLHTTLEGTVAISLVVADAIGLKGLETNPEVLMLRAATKARESAKE